MATAPVSCLVLFVKPLICRHESQASSHIHWDVRREEGGMWVGARSSGTASIERQH